MVQVTVKKVWTPAQRRGRNAAIGAAIGVAAGLAPFQQRGGGGGGKVLAATLAITGGTGAGLGSLNRGRDLVYKSP